MPGHGDEIEVRRATKVGADKSRTMVESCVGGRDRWMRKDLA